MIQRLVQFTKPIQIIKHINIIKGVFITYGSPGN
jgi:hypothetical protein